jgi:DNA-binding LytR/AlgR family response regulator
MKTILIDDDRMSLETLKSMLESLPNIDVIAEFENPVKAVSFVKRNHVDLIFLDLEMPEMTGMQFVEALKDRLPKVILTTSYDKFAIDAFKYNVSGYILKPLDFTSISKAVNKVYKNFDNKTSIEIENNLVFVRYGSTIEKIKKEDLVMVQCSGDYARIISKSKKYTVKSTMKDLEAKLCDTTFIRVHNSYIINLDLVDKIQDLAFIIDEKEVPIGRTYKQKVFSKLNII